MTQSRQKTKRNAVGKIRQRNQNRILKAAADEFVRCGYKGTSIQAIADRVSLPKANVLYYFKSKKGVYLAVLKAILELWNQGFADDAVNQSPAEVLERYIRGKMHYSRTHPKESKIFAQELINGAPVIHDAIELPMVSWTEGKATVIQSWIERGALPPVEPLYLLFLIWGATQFYADCDTEIELIKGRRLNDREFDQATQFVVDMVLQGLNLKPISPVTHSGI